MQWKIGDITIDVIRERQATIPIGGMFPGSNSDEVIAANADWLKPHFVDDEGNMTLNIQCFVVRSQGKTIVIDTCVGNRPVPGHETMSNLGAQFMVDFKAAGFDPDTVDIVMCTHLHFDHVGWNTILVDGKWVPTFPNARYLFGKLEYEHWDAGNPGSANTFGDAVRPVFEAGLATLVAMDHRLSDEIWFEPTVGHTPGHMSIHLSSRGERAVITGDMMHHPIQISNGGVDWPMSADVDSPQAAKTRRSFRETHADQPVLVIGTHFAAPTAGHIKKVDGDFRFV
jgi:glyoxylase-like metal-dependent hydrolase (beta-lactamase superfamily II)